jgi:hypothetical protein|tara:strand:+ start:231 stop:716 length:486 start_codon:yes stop_codon:yes gene_type:complete
MANNVYSTIKFVKGDHEAEREFIRIFEFIETYEERSLEFSDFFRTNQEIVDQEFMETWVGPRKAEITKFMGTEVEVKSAWISPHVFLFNLIEHLRDFDPDIKISMSYEDEFLNFAGVYVNEKNQEESGGWFKEQFDERAVEDDFLGFVEEVVEMWEEELCD